MRSIETNTILSGLISTSSFSSSSPPKMDNVLINMQNFIDENNNNKGQRTHHRGRSHSKRSQSTEENVCVVAFLVKEQNEKQKQVLDQIQDVRRKFDQAYRRWEPHLTLIPPFIVPFSSPLLVDQSINSLKRKEPLEQHNLLRDTLDSLCNSIQAVCLDINQHTLTLDEVGHFALKPYDTIHLRPSTNTKNDVFLHLQSELEAALPLVMSNARSKKSQVRDIYKPHLTLGQYSKTNVKVNQQLQQQANQLLKGQANNEEPIRIKVDKIQLMVKPVNRSGPYDVFREFSLNNVK